MAEFNILVVGVGGQGILFISEILGDAALREGLNTKVAEIHGMAQRGGSVACNIRIAKDVHSPTITEGTADIIVGLEPLEVLRNLKYANHETKIFLNIATIPPSSSYISRTPYPDKDKTLNEISKVTKKIFIINTIDIAKKTGMTATQNTVMLGFIAAANILPIKSKTFITEIVDRVPSRYKDSNLEAFKLGIQEYKKL